MIDYVQEEIEKQKVAEQEIPEPETDEIVETDDAEDVGESDFEQSEDDGGDPPVDVSDVEERVAAMLIKSGKFKIVQDETPEAVPTESGPKLVEVPDVLDDPEGFAKAVQQNALVQAQHAMLTMSRGSIEERLVQAIEAKAAKLGMELSDTAKAAIRRDARSAAPEQLQSIVESPQLHAGLAEQYVEAYPAPKPKKIKGMSVQPNASMGRAPTTKATGLDSQQRAVYEQWCAGFGYDKSNKEHLVRFKKHMGID